MKIRIGYGLGTQGLPGDGHAYTRFIDDLERLRFDSLWFSERINGYAPDPCAAMAFAAARTTRLKLGMSVMVLPGRNPVLVAKELASIDLLSNGRLLPAFGLGAADPREHAGFGVDRGRGGRSLLLAQRVQGQRPDQQFGTAVLAGDQGRQHRLDLQEGRNRYACAERQVVAGQLPLIALSLSNTEGPPCAALSFIGYSK